MPVSFGAMPAKIAPPQTAATRTPTATPSSRRSTKPVTTRKPKSPKTTPEAPAVFVLSGDTSQTPSPSATMISAQTAAKRRRPPSAERNPSTSSGTLFAATWPKPKWMNEAGTTSASSGTERGTIPKSSSA